MGVTGKFPGMAAGAFRHADDRKAMTMLRKIPGVEWTAGQLVKRAYEKKVRLEQLASAIKVGPRAFGVLDAMADEICAALAVSRPELFVRQDVTVSAYAVGEAAPVLVMGSGLLELLDEEEMYCALAHEISHIHCRHLPALMISDFLRAFAGYLGLAGSVLAGVRLAVEEWRRAAQFSCDRGALLVTGDEKAMLSLLTKLAGGARSDSFGAVDPEVLAEQKRAFDETGGGSLGKLHRMLICLDSSHSFAALRVAELKAWAASGEYAAFRKGSYPRSEDAAAEDEPLLWGEFVPRGEGIFAVGEEPAAAGEVFAQSLKTAADSAAQMAQSGATALGEAVGAFFDAFQQQREARKTKQE